MNEMARFENCYGPEGTWRGGWEKAPAALRRDVLKVWEGTKGRLSLGRQGAEAEGLLNLYKWPRVSIVTPSYNQGRFIGETIRSVLQGQLNLEYNLRICGPNGIT